MSKLNLVILVAITAVRHDEKMIMPGKKFEVDEKVAESLIGLKAAKLVTEDDDVIEAEIIEPGNDDEDLDGNVGDEVLTEISKMISEDQKEALKAAGFDSYESLKEATKADLTAVSGVGDATADKILKALEA